MESFKYKQLIVGSLLSLNLLSCQSQKIGESQTTIINEKSQNSKGLSPEMVTINPDSEIRLLRSALLAATKDTFIIENENVKKLDSLVSFESVTNSKCISTPDSQFDFSCKRKNDKTVFRVSKELEKGNFGIKIYHYQPVPKGIIVDNVILSDYLLGLITSTTQPSENPPQKWTTLSNDCFIKKNINPKIPITFIQINTFGKNKKTGGWARFNSPTVKESFANLEKALNKCKLEE